MRKLLLKYGLAIVPLVVLAWYVVVEFSVFAAVLAKAALGVAFLYGIIKYGHDEVDAIEQMLRDPIAYALMMLAYALVIAASFAL